MKLFNRVARGGAFNHVPSYMRAIHRVWGLTALLRGYDEGFRLIVRREA